MPDATSCRALVTRLARIIPKIILVVFGPIPTNPIPTNLTPTTPIPTNLTPTSPISTSRADRWCGCDDACSGSSYANIRYANISYANISYANICIYANISYANICIYANGREGGQRQRQSQRLSCPLHRAKSTSTKPTSIGTSTYANICI
jgi:hypothetical protein